MKLRIFLSTIFILLFLSGQGFAVGSKFDRFATDAETAAQTRDDIGITPANIPSIMAAPGTVGELKQDHTVETLNADRTILITDKPVLWFDCNGSDRNVTLCPMATNSTDLVFTIVNRSDGAGEDLVVKDGNAAPVTLFVIGPGQGQRFSCDGTDWKTWFDSGVYYDGVSEIRYFYIAGVRRFLVSASYIGSNYNLGGAIRNTQASDVNPSINSALQDADTGLGYAGTDQLSLIAGGVEGQRIVEANSVIYNLLGVTQQDSVTDGESNTSTTISSDGAAGDNFLTTCQVGDAVLIWGGTTTADYGIYWIVTVTDDNNLVVDRALSATDSDIDFYILRGGVLQGPNSLNITGRISNEPVTFAFTTEADITDPLTTSSLLLDGDNDSESDTIDLQDGTTPGQVLYLIATTDIDADDTCTINMTDTTCTNCPAIVFNKVGENAHLLWTGSTWAIISIQDAL